MVVNNLIRDVDRETILNKQDFVFSNPGREDIGSNTFFAFSSIVPTAPALLKEDTLSSRGAIYYDNSLMNEFAAWENASDSDFAEFEKSL
ncbi:MAG: hypothetical protein JW768_02335 [Chitinispirillaceae bacterium]|nr:hypothetical protein [Chitinispirillaceae bacterium]